MVTFCLNFGCLITKRDANGCEGFVGGKNPLTNQTITNQAYLFEKPTQKQKKTRASNRLQNTAFSYCKKHLPRNHHVDLRNSAYSILGVSPNASDSVPWQGPWLLVLCSSLSQKNSEYGGYGGVSCSSSFSFPCCSCLDLKISRGNQEGLPAGGHAMPSRQRHGGPIG